jgi:hypothetical protein
VSEYYELASSPGSGSSVATRTRPGEVWTCPGGFAAVSRSLLMLTPGDDTSPLERQQQLDGNRQPHNGILVTTSTSVLESGRDREALKGGVLDDIGRSHQSALANVASRQWSGQRSPAARMLE